MAGARVAVRRARMVEHSAAVAELVGLAMRPAAEALAGLVDTEREAVVPQAVQKTMLAE